MSMRRGIPAWAFLMLAAGCRTTLSAPPPGAESVEFRGNEALSRGELLEVIRDSLAYLERTGQRKAAIDDAAFLLEQRYRDRGHAFAVVDYELDPEEDGARFDIDEGPRVRLAAYDLVGVGALDVERVAAILDQRLFPPDRDGAAYSEAAADAAVSDVAAYYRENGFLDVRARVVDVVFDRGRTSASLSLEVEEGQRWWLASVYWSGDIALPEDELGRSVAGDIGRAYTPRLAVTLAGRAAEMLRERGHPDASVEIVETSRSPDGGVSLTLRVDPGPEVRIAGVRVLGNEKTDAGFLRGRIVPEAGDLYAASAIRETFNRLYATGLFREIRMRLEPEDGSRRELVVEVVELESIELFVEPGYGSYELLKLRTGLRNKNLFGTGRILRAEASASAKALGFEVGLTDPWLLGTDTTVDTALIYERREEPSFEFEDVGTDVSISRRWTRRLSTRLGYRFRRSELIDEDVDPTAAGAEEDFDVSAIELGSVYNTRDGIFNPTRGFRSQVGLELANQALGSEIEFLRGTLGHAQYFSLGGGTVLAAHVKTGMIAPIGDTDAIPLQERFFNGGENSVRSFKEGELGAKDADGDPVGGEAASLLSVELRRPIFGKLEGAIFFDTGNVVPDQADYLDFEDFRHAVGGGLRYILPVGPVRIDVGVNPDPEDEEDDFVVHFSIGRSF